MISPWGCLTTFPLTERAFTRESCTLQWYVHNDVFKVGDALEPSCDCRTSCCGDDVLDVGYIWGGWGHCPLGAHALPLGDLSACGFLSALANSAFPMARMLVLSSVGLLACVLQAPASSTTLRVQTQLQPQLRSVPATIASFLTATQSGLVSIFRTFEVLHLTSPRRLTPNRVLRELYSTAQIILCLLISNLLTCYQLNHLFHSGRHHVLGGGSSPPLPTLLPPPARPAKPAWKTCDCCGEEVPPSTCVICGWCRCTFHEECYDLHCPCPDTGGGGAKGGLEQRLVLALPSVFPWFKRVGANKHRNFNISFNELNQWIEHGMSVLGCEDSWSSHELRPGGTNGLLTQGYIPAS